MGEMVKLDLQRFADGGPDMGAAGGGVDTGAAANMAQAQNGGAQAQGESPFQQMIQGQYKQEYEQAVGQRVQQAIQQRFKNNRDLQQRLDAVNPIMEQLGAKYGVDADDVDGIYKHMTDDLSLYQQEADEKGVSPEVVRDMHRLEARNRQLQQQNDRFTEQGRIEAHFQQLSQQAEELRRDFPGFDLMTELQNPRFARMTAPGSGISVREAFNALHADEIYRNGMRYAAQQTQRNIAASVQAGASRPLENGMQRQNPVNMGVDIAHMDKKTREAYRQRIKNGEKIDFQNNV